MRKEPENSLVQWLYSQNFLTDIILLGYPVEDISTQRLVDTWATYD